LESGHFAGQIAVKAIARGFISILKLFAHNFAAHEPAKSPGDEVQACIVFDVPAR
jgi:hypothetical protein